MPEGNKFCKDCSELKFRTDCSEFVSVMDLSWQFVILTLTLSPAYLAASPYCVTLWTTCYSVPESPKFTAQRLSCHWVWHFEEKIDHGCQGEYRMKIKGTTARDEDRNRESKKEQEEDGCDRVNHRIFTAVLLLFWKSPQVQLPLWS